MDYAVHFGDDTVGKAQVTRQGLYYHVVCRCSLSGQVMYCLEASTGEKRVNLGILVPQETGFGLETRFPVSRVGEGELSFRLRPRHDELGGRSFVPITPEEPFAYLERLKEAFLEIQNGKKGASIPKSRE
ncbi:MAG: hypothetical protein SO355_08220 [Candidatus Faecousia sp.]|nr:hypothetical protein [Bacillota bacterium]MDY4755303.1 hypothetical protein [Candidatus Faecousia sp.]MDY6159968.1 hypothetical protein [Candidatus Faecousia sp.]